MKSERQSFRKAGLKVSVEAGSPTSKGHEFTLGSEMSQASRDFFQSHLSTKLGRHPKTFPNQIKSLRAPVFTYFPFEDFHFQVFFLHACHHLPPSLFTSKIRLLIHSLTPEPTPT